LKNNPAKCLHDSILNDRALGVFEECHPNDNNNKNSKMSSDMGSVPDKKTEKISALA